MTRRAQPQDVEAMLGCVSTMVVTFWSTRLAAAFAVIWSYQVPGLHGVADSRVCRFQGGHLASSRIVRGLCERASFFWAHTREAQTYRLAGRTHGDASAIQVTLNDATRDSQGARNPLDRLPISIPCSDLSRGKLVRPLAVTVCDRHRCDVCLAEHQADGAMRDAPLPSQGAYGELSRSIVTGNASAGRHVGDLASEEHLDNDMCSPWMKAHGTPTALYAERYRQAREAAHA